MAVPLLLIVLTALQVRDGTTASLPSWIAGFVRATGADEIVALRALIGVEIAVTLILILVGRWASRLALVTLAIVVFSALASASAAVSLGQSLWPSVTVALVASILFMALVKTPGHARSGGSLQWRVIVAIISLIIGGAVSARLSLERARPASTSRTRAAPRGAIELAVLDWPGQLICETPIKEHRPELTPLTLEGRSVIVFYNPRCSRCHEVFLSLVEFGIYDDQPVGGAPAVDRVIAIEVPPAEGAILAAGDDLEHDEEIECPGCTRLVLPGGPLWLVQAPTVVVVDDGRVTCVEEGGPPACLLNQE